MARNDPNHYQVHRESTDSRFVLVAVATDPDSPAEELYDVLLVQDAQGDYWVDQLWNAGWDQLLDVGDPKLEHVTNGALQWMQRLHAKRLKAAHHKQKCLFAADRP